MTNWLISSSLLLSVLVTCLWLLRRYTLHWIGARGLYYLWSLLPLGMVLCALPQWQTSNPAALYIVKVQSVARDWLTDSTPVFSSLTPYWATGAFVLFSVLIIHYLRWTRKHLQHSRSTKVYGLPVPIKVVKSSLAQTPFMMATPKPVIVVPEQFEHSYSQGQQRLIIEHELHHWRRGDLVWNLLASLLLSLFWFNPLMWLAQREFYRCQELACDESVLQHQPESVRLDYAKALLTSSTITSSFAPILPLMPHYGGVQQVKERMMTIQQLKELPAGRMLAIGALAVACMMITTLVSAKATKEGPSAVKRVPPQYPAQAAEQGLTGDVKLEFDIDETGQVHNVEVTGTTDAMFNQHAKNALQQWRYQATGQYHRDMKIQLSFRLDDEEAEKHDEPYQKDQEMIPER